MREIHFLREGKPDRAVFMEDIHDEVKKLYPTVRRDWSINGWLWWVGDRVVAEAWVSSRGNWWDYKVVSESQL